MGLNSLTVLGPIKADLSNVITAGTRREPGLALLDSDLLVSSWRERSLELQRKETEGTVRMRVVRLCLNGSMRRLRGGDSSRVGTRPESRLGGFIVTSKSYSASGFLRPFKRSGSRTCSPDPTLTTSYAGTDHLSRPFPALGGPAPLPRGKLRRPQPGGQAGEVLLISVASGLSEHLSGTFPVDCNSAAQVNASKCCLKSERCNL